MQLIERIKEKIERESMSVLTMSKQTAIPAYRIYKWIDGKGRPKSDDTGKLEKWLSGTLDKVPNENIKDVSNPNDPAFLAGQLSMVERLIAKLEKENETIQAEKEQLLKTLDKAQDAIIKALEPIKEYTGKILANSETIQSDLEVLTGIVRSDDEVMLKGTDRILGREEGASSTEAGIGERAFLVSDKEDHMTDSSDKQHNSGKGRRQRKA